MNLQRYDAFWYSNDVSALMKLIKLCPDITDLFSYMANRPKAPVNMVKFNDNGSGDVVFVVPTADINNETSSNLRRQINNGPIIFVESSGPDFNYSQSCNAGISLALKEGFKWIIISNDDIIFKQNLDNLIEFTESSDGNSVLTPRNGIEENKRYHGEEFAIFKTNAVLLGLTLYNSKWSFEGNKISWPYFSSYLRNFPFFLRHMKYVVGVNNTAQTFQKISRRVTDNIINFGDFGIFPAGILKKYHFDETYWNGGEDYDMSFRLHLDKIPIRKINFDVESIGSASLGRTVRKHILTLFNSLYLSDKLTSLIN